MMQRVLKWSWIGVVLLVLIGGQPTHPARAQDDVSWLLSEMNNLRAGHGLPAYTLNAQLSAAAQQQSQYLVETCNVAHVWPDGTSPANRAAANGYPGTHILENIYAGTNATASSAWNFFLNSPSHYNALVNTIVTEVGIGVAHGGLCSHAYTLVFGRAGDGSAPPIQAGVSSAPAAAAAAAPPAPNVPPPPPSTPTATIPTLTPSATWTVTPSPTPTATYTAITPSATPVDLPTIARDDTAVAVAASSTSTPVEITSTHTPSPIPPTPTALPPNATPVPAARPTSPPVESGFTVRDLLPLALIGQMVLIGVAGFAYFRKSR